MSAHEFSLDCEIILKGPITASEQQIMEAAILHFILKLPPEKRPQKGDKINVSQWVGGRIPTITGKS